jgi:hypothetical protein
MTSSPSSLILPGHCTLNIKQSSELKSQPYTHANRTNAFKVHPSRRRTAVQCLRSLCQSLPVPLQTVQAHQPQTHHLMSWKFDSTSSTQSHSTTSNPPPQRAFTLPGLLIPAIGAKPFARSKLSSSSSSSFVIVPFLPIICFAFAFVLN